MNALVISGAGGFLGKQVIHAAVTEGFSDITAITSKSSSEFPAGVTCVRLEDFLQGKYSFARDAIFINCLFPTNADGKKMAEGLERSFALIDAAADARIQNMINISSQSVYASKRSEAASETSELSLESAYAVGKYCVEKYVARVFQGRNFSNIRMSSLVGVGYDQRIVNRLVMQAVAGKQIKVVGGMQKYGLLDVKDAAAALVQLCRLDSSKWSNTYVVGRKEVCSLLDVVTLISEVAVDYGITVQYELSEGEDNRNSALDPSLFMSDCQWDAKVPLRQTIKEIFEEKISG